jgi:hypothetical protein
MSDRAPMGDSFSKNVMEVTDLGHEGGRPILCEWKITTTPVDEDGNLIPEKASVTEQTNLVVNTGRTRLMSLAFVPSASAAGGFYFLGVGASATVAAVTDTRLTYELIGNPTRQTLLNSNNGTVNTGNIQLLTIVVGGVTFYEFLQLQATYLTNDGNNLNTFAEYGIFDSATLPGSPTSTSGTMFNHLIDPNPSFKSTTNQILSQITIRM